MVVVIEKDKTSAWALSMVLQDAGYHTLVAAAGEEAAEKLKNVDAAPIAIISDFDLDGAMDGVEAARTFARAADDPLPTIITSSHDSADAKRKAIAAGFRYCPKPMDPDHLLGLLETALTAR